MVQTERETGALRGQFARQVTVQASAAAQAESARAQAEQLSRKLAAARAEVRRYSSAASDVYKRQSAPCLPSSTIMQSWRPPASRHGSSWSWPTPGQKRLKPPAAEPKLPLQPYSRLPRKHPHSRTQSPRLCRSAKRWRNSLRRKRKNRSAPRNRHCPRSLHSRHGSRRPGWNRWLWS